MKEAETRQVAWERFGITLKNTVPSLVLSADCTAGFKFPAFLACLQRVGSGDVAISESFLFL